MLRRLSVYALALVVVSLVGVAWGSTPSPVAQGVSFRPTYRDYITNEPLVCGGTYQVVYSSWLTSKISASAIVAGTAQLEIDTYEYSDETGQWTKVWRDFWNTNVPNAYVGRFDDFLSANPELYRFQSQVRGTGPGPIVTQTCDLTLSEASR